MSFKDLKNLPPHPFRKLARMVGEPKVLPYDIIEVLEDPEFLKHFMRRFQMSCVIIFYTFESAYKICVMINFK